MKCLCRDSVAIGPWYIGNRYVAIQSKAVAKHPLAATV